MRDFDEIEYFVRAHAAQRLLQRAPGDFPNMGAKKVVEYCCKNGHVILEFRRWRIIQFGQLIFPCQKAHGNVYTVITTLTESMIKHRPQALIRTSKGRIL